MCEELLTVNEVAKVLKTNVNYVHALRKTGQLKFLKLGCYKVRRETLNEFIRNSEGLDLTDPSRVRRLEDD